MAEEKIARQVAEEEVNGATELSDAEMENVAGGSSEQIRVCPTCGGLMMNGTCPCCGYRAK